jgi:hypothetical protein
LLSKNATNHGFICRYCNRDIPPAPKTARNHCPHCFYSLHVDAMIPGDRLETCGGLMKPAAIFQKNGKWVVIHLCEKCGIERRNRLAPDDNFETAIKLNCES